jgi:hypothetical protein
MCPFAEALQQLLGFLGKRFVALFSARFCLAYSIFRFVMTHLRHGPDIGPAEFVGSVRLPVAIYAGWPTLFIGSGDEI